MGDFREHGVMLYLSKDLYIAFIRLQADRGLGRSYAGLLPFTEGMYHLGYISKEAYEEHTGKYSEKLVSENTHLDPKQAEEKQRLQQKDRFFKEVLTQWEIHHTLEWREKMLKQAEMWKDKLESARLVLGFREKAVLLDGR